jgi:hypothetical protein
MRGAPPRGRLSTRGRSAPVAPRILLLGTALCASACAGLGQGGTPTALMKASGTQTTTSEIRAVANGLAVRIPGLVEQTGDRMLGSTLDPALRRAALRWKIEGVNAFHQTLFRPDPLAALFQTWALAVQVDDWVNSERIRNALGLLQHHAADGAREIREEVQTAAVRAAKTPDGARRMQEMVESWAHAHPIEGTFATRPTPELLLAKMASQQDTGLVEAFGQATSTLDDLSIKMDLYVAALPKSASWEVELAMLDGMESDNGKLMLASLQSFHGVFSKVDAMLGGPAVTGGRDIQGTLKSERVALMSDFDRQRVDVMDRLTQERVAVLQNIDGQRVAALSDLDRKIDHSLQGADGLRQRAMADLEPMITRIGLRLGVLVGALMCLGTLLVWLLIRSKALHRLHEKRTPRSPEN